MDRKPANAFITARKGFCYLTIRLFGRNHEMMRVRAYKIDPDEKRQMRRLYPEVAFDWKKITQQLAEKREACRRYRTRPRTSPRRVALHDDGPVFGVYESASRTIYTSGIPSTTVGVWRLLDAVVQFNREQTAASLSSQPLRRAAEPALMLAHNPKPSKP